MKIFDGNGEFIFEYNLKTSGRPFGRRYMRRLKRMYNFYYFLSLAILFNR